jgi:TonB family protein
VRTNPGKVLSSLCLLLALAAGTPRVGGQQAEQPRQAPSEVPLPKRVRFVSPSYPPEAMAQGLRGIVILELVIDTQGKVASVDVVRSVPPFDEAAVSAVRQWEYEVTKVDGKPVPVRITLPITFAIKLPEMTRETGIPELVRGVSPFLPPGGGNRGATVKAELTLDVDGSLAEARVTSGESPWAESMIQALRTWRFAPPGGDGQLSFEAQAEFVPSGKDGPRVILALRAPRRVASASPGPATEAPGLSPSPSPEAPAPPAQASPEPAPVPSPEAAHPAPEATPTATAAATLPSPSPSPVPSPTPPAEAPAPTTAGAAPATAPSTPAAPPAAPSPAATADKTTPPPPPVEIIPAAPPSQAPAGQAAGGQAAPGQAAAAPPAEGVSAVRDVTLGAGVPDLASGRRPMVPPFARMSGTSGQVVVRFAVDAAGVTSGFQIEGPEMLREAARQTVASWTFRRDRAERVYLRGTLSYEGDLAHARVERAE